MVSDLSHANREFYAMNIQRDLENEELNEKELARGHGRIYLNGTYSNRT